jgi:hypothetical protein
LYQYRCTDDEFASLQATLQQPVAIGGSESAKRRVLVEYSPMFVLFAAEWWRRHHVGGPWKWEPIFRAIGLEIRNIVEIYPAVQRGLRGYWGRELLRGGHRTMFLVTLACEGGLPLQLLRNHGGRLKTFFRKLLEEYGRYGGTQDAVDIARSLEDELPGQLRQDIVFELGALLIKEIWALRAKVKGENDPIATLDSVDPQWRDRLPLEANDEIVEAFLRDLVEVTLWQSSDFQYVRTLHKTESGFEIRGELNAPPSVSLPFLAARVGISENQISVRGDILLVSDRGEIRRAAQVALVQREGEQRCRVEKLSSGSRVHGPEAVDGWALQYESFSTHGSRVSLRGGEPLSPDLPWVFGRIDEATFRFVGQGTVRTKFPRCLVICPTGSNCAELQIEGRLHDGRALVSIEEVLFLTGSDGSVFRIRPAEAQEDALNIEVDGLLYRGAVDERQIFLGPPEFRFRDADDRMRRLPAERLEWRAIGSREWRQWSDGDALGRIKVRLIEGGETRFQQDIELLPPDFRVELSPKSIRDGSVRVCTVRPTKTKIEITDAFVVTRIDSDEGELFHLRAEGAPPAYFDIALSFGDSREIGLAIPFPSRGARFVEHGDLVLRHESIRPLDEAEKIRAEGFTPADDDFAIEATLVSESQTDFQAGFLYKLTRLENGRRTFELRRAIPALKNLLASTSEVDAQVELRIHGPGVGPTKVIIRQFGSEFVIEGKIVSIRNPLDSLPVQDLDHCSAEAVRLWDPSAPRVPLPYDEGRGWFLNLPDEVGPWLLLGTRGDSSPVRPRVLYVSGEPEGRSPLQLAIMLPGPQASEAIVEELIRLTDHPFAEEWQVVSSSFLLAREIPAVSLRLLRGIAQRPAAAILALCLEAEERQHVWDAMESLAFEWYLVPLKDWLTSLSRWSHELEAISEGLGSRSLADLIDFLSSSAERKLLFPLFDHMAALMAGRSRPRLSIPERSMLSMDLADACQTLFAVHDGQQWPVAESILSVIQPAVTDVNRELPAMRADVPRFKKAVLWGPFAAARVAVFGVGAPRDFLLHVRRVRRFDPDYFDRAYAIAWRVMHDLSSVVR